MLRLETPSGTSDFAGNIDVSDGTLFVVGDYRNTSPFAVKNGATLSGTGIIGGGTIETGGTLKPRGPSGVYSILTVNGSLTFAAGSNFDVHIASHDNGTVSNDQVIVTNNGTVNIDPNANLNVSIDYWSPASDWAERFTIIDATDGVVGKPSDEFTLRYTYPLGVKMLQGWNGKLFQLYFEFDPTKGFGNLCIKHNRIEIGTTLDWFTENHDGGLKNLIDRLSDPSWTDPEICDQLDQITGDLTVNALFMALKEPWRHPFNRLKLGCPIHVAKKFQRELWGEFTARYENVGYDNNAHGFTVNRYGIAVGVDQRLSRRSIIGATFQYADPRLRQETGKVRMDDYEVGLYNMTRLTDQVDAKLYLGYSHQNYRFDRYVSLPAPPSGNFGPFNERLYGQTSGDALSASVELIRTMTLQNGLRLLPVAAFDFEQAWIRGYRESEGLTSLVYDSASLERLMLRFGIGGEYELRNRITLNGRLQYATQLNSKEYPAVGARFNTKSVDQRTADIWGSRLGRDYLNLGIGTNWKLNNRGDKWLYVNYDAKWFNQATIHAGEAGFVKKW